jgi:hypothetical protein
MPTPILNRAHDNIGKIRNDHSISYNESNVFSLTDADVFNPVTIISSCAEDVTVGLGTYDPSCRLSFGKNTANVLDGEIQKSSISAICFNEERNGKDATGITYYERFDDVTGQRAEAGMAFVVSNENYFSTYDGTAFINNIDVSKNKIIPMSILSRISGHSAVLINHDPAQITERAVFGNERVSVDISGALRTSEFLILGNSTSIVQNSTDFSTLNDGTLIFDGEKLYIKQIGVNIPTEILLRNDSIAGAQTEFIGYTPQSQTSSVGIYQTQNTLFGAVPVANIFKNTVSVNGSAIFGKDTNYINNSINFFGDNTRQGMISVETGIGINSFNIGAAIDANCSTMPYIIMGIDNVKEDISQNSIVFGDSNDHIGTKSTVFGDDNYNSGTYLFNIGTSNQNRGNNCFIQGTNNNTNINKSTVFGESNFVKDTEISTSPNKNQHNFVAGYNNTLIDGSSNYIFGTKIDTSGVSYSTAFGYNADVSNNIRFAIGTEELNGNAFTMDISGNINMEGDIDCITNEDKGIFESCSSNITIGNANTLTLFPGEVSNYSDERLKFNVEPIENSLSAVCKLRGVRYNRNDTDNDKKHIGLIAQEVEKIVPEVVNIGSTSEKLLSVNYGNLVSLLIESIKELNSSVETLKQENAGLKTDVKILKEQMKEVLHK